MASLADLEAICLALPQVTGEGANFAVGRKALCWPYLARTTPRARREAVPGVLAIRSALETQDMLIAAAPTGSSTTTTTAAIRRCSHASTRWGWTSFRACSGRPGDCRRRPRS